jgi:NAD(P)-dependent dehydrogenase (short-subunit alcohol dehydrogenase family)
MDIAGKVVDVTGAARGIGARWRPGSSRTCRAGSWSPDIDQESVELVVKQPRDSGAAAIAVPADITEKAAAET